ncbi:MAG: hypothetical protein ABIQ95_15580 [Bdellovibrionia bacterium]
MKRQIKITDEFGIIIRKKALLEKSIKIEAVLAAFENESPMDENEDLISFGPHFGGEAMDNFGKRLTKLGLEYIDDYFNFYGEFPGWAEFSVALKA